MTITEIQTKLLL